MNFSRRAIELHEQMDDPGCDPKRLTATYHHFVLMNRLVAGWRRIYRRWLRPVVRSVGGPCRLLDVGCGGGDIPARLIRWAEADKLNLSIVGIDTDPRAIAHARTHHAHDRITYRVAGLDALDDGQPAFDVILSNHVLHHLSNADVPLFLAATSRMARQLVLHNDIHRSPAGYHLFRYSMPVLFRNAYTVEDGLISIRRSFTRAELASLAPAGWTIQRMAPWRVIAIREKGVGA